MGSGLLLQEMGGFPGVGDPAFLGWLTTFLYILAAMLCCAAMRKSPGEKDQGNHASENVFWSGLALALFVLGANKQLDLQSWVTDLGREIARSLGWLNHRRGIQAAVVVVISIIGLIGGGTVTWIMRKFWRRYALALVGMFLLILFVMIRSATSYHLERAVPWPLSKPPAQSSLEIIGICCIVAGAVRTLRRSSFREPC